MVSHSSFILPLSSHCLLWSFSMLSLGYAVRSFSCLKCGACLLWYINTWTRPTLGNSGCCPSVMENSNLIWKNTSSEDWSQQHCLPRDCCASDRAIHTSATFVRHATPTASGAQQSQGEFLSPVSIYLAEAVENLVMQLIITLQLQDAVLLHCTKLNLAVFSEVTLIFSMPRQYRSVSPLISSVPSELLRTHTSHQSLARPRVVCFFFKYVPST